MINIINKAQLVVAAVLIGIVLCVNSALKEDGLYIGKPRMTIVYRNAPEDPRLMQLASAVKTTPAMRGR